MDGARNTIMAEAAEIPAFLRFRIAEPLLLQPTGAFSSDRGSSPGSCDEMEPPHS